MRARAPATAGSRTAPALLVAVVVLVACARRVPPPEPPARPAVQRPAPAAPPRPALRPGRPDAARTERDRRAEAVCADRGSLVEDRVRDAGETGQAGLGVDAVLAGQSAREACLRDYRRTGEMPAPL